MAKRSALTKHVRQLPSAGGVKKANIGKTGGGPQTSLVSSSGPHHPHLPGPNSYAGSKGVGASNPTAKGLGGGGTGGPRTGFLPSSYENGRK